MSKKAIIILVAVFVLAIIAIFAATAVFMTSDTSSQKNNQNNGNTAQTENGRVILEDGTIDYAKMAEDASKKISKGDKTAQTYQDQGVASYNLGDLNEAESSYKLAIKADSKDPSNYTYLGNVLRDQSDFDGAEKQYRKAIEVAPNFVTAYVNLAVMKYAMLDDADGARKILQDGLAKVPDDPQLIELQKLYK